MFITGMHRSGTSATANIVTRLGLRQNTELLPAHLFNPGGHFESVELYQANEAILGTLGYLWDAPPHSGLKERELHAIRDSGLLERLRHQFQDRSTSKDWCDKDPRLAITLPVWDQVLLRQTPVIACIRNPSEVATSLRLREGFPFELGVILWRHYNQNLRDNCKSRETLVLDYELDLKLNTAGTVQRIAAFAKRCGYNIEESRMEDAISAFEPNYHRSTVLQPGEHADSAPSKRLEHAFTAYTEMREKPISQWPEALENSTQVLDEDDQWLALYKRSKIIEQAAIASQAAARSIPPETDQEVAPARAESRWTRLLKDPSASIMRRIKGASQS